MKIELAERIEQNISTKTYKLVIDGETYFWIDYLQGEKVIDNVLRDESGYDISMDQPDLVEEIEKFVDGVEKDYPSP